MSDAPNSSSKLDCFDGSDVSQYKKWRRRASLMIMSRPTNYPAEKHGRKLTEYIKGEAEQACEHIPLGKAGGHNLILKTLDEKYKPLEKDDLSEALREYFFECQIKQHEQFKNFVTC